LYGCTIKPIDDDIRASERLIHIPKNSPESSFVSSSALKEMEEDRNKITLITSPDLAGKPQEKDWARGVPIKNVKMRAVGQWDDGSNYRVVIQFDNSEGPSVTASVNLYAYDRMGRLVRNENFEKYFREGTISSVQYSFSKAGSEVRWIFTLTGK